MYKALLLSNLNVESISIATPNPLAATALSDWGTGPKAAKILEALGSRNWQPSTPEERIDLWIARRDVDSLRSNWSIAGPVLQDYLANGQSQDQRKAVLIQIVMGRQEFVDDAHAALDATGSVRLAETFLNCGHEPLAEIARIWAADNGHHIISGSGSTDAIWNRR